MKINFLAIGALAAALAIPLGASAQQNQPPGAYSQNRSNPSEARMQHRWAKRLGRLNLSGDQQQRVQALINQYSQSHPEGTPRDPAASRELRRQLMGVLTPDQQNQLHAQMRAHRAQMQQRGSQTQQGGYDQRYQQGYQDQQGAPDQRYQQQGPPDQQYQQQGPPDQQYQQQGPPQYQQQGPPQYPQQGPPPDQQEPSGPPPA